MHNLMPYNGNNININNGSYPGQNPMMGTGHGFNDTTSAGMLQLMQMMMTLTATMLTMMMGQQSGLMQGGTPNFGGPGGAGGPGLGNFLGSGGGGSRDVGGPGGGAQDGGNVGSPTGNMVDLGGGKKVDASIAPSVRSMIQAAKKDGVDLKISSGFRSRQQQEVLYAKYKAGTGNLAAKPGTSNHESGLAIDFSNTPGAYDWLKKNAGRFGLKNLPSEPWHYSTNGR